MAKKSSRWEGEGDKGGREGGGGGGELGKKLKEKKGRNGKVTIGSKKKKVFNAI